jgi:hypothetical protein
MQSDTALPALATTCACRPSILNRLGQHRWLLGGVAFALLAAGFAWQWSWLVAIGVAPLLISTAPCLAMCALGLCMHRIGNRAGNVTQDASTARVTFESIPQQQES